jgi:subtilisin family serine protease
VLFISVTGCIGSVDEPEVSKTTASLSSSPSQSYLVSFTTGTIPADASTLITAAGGSIAARYANLGMILARSSSLTFATTLRATTGIDAVGAANAVQSSIAPVRSHASHHPGGGKPSAGDPLSFRQWDMDQIRAPQAHAFSVGKKSVLVGVIDSGVDPTHPDLDGQVNAAASVSCLGGVPNTDPAVWANDFIGHGTHVSGIIAGKQNGIGIIGVAPGVQVAAAKVAVDDPNDPNFTLVFADAFVCAVDWAIGHGFDLMSASLTIDPFTGPIDDIFCSDQPDRVAIVKMVRRAVLAAARKNITLVASTGNFFTDLASLTGTTPGSTCKVIPVQLPRVIGVSSVGYTQQLAFYSNYGFGAADLTGPGGDANVPDPLVTDRDSSGQVVSSIPPGSFLDQLAADWDGRVQDCSSGTCASYAYLQGTSQATPHVTGVAALALSRFGTMSPDALLALLSLTAKPLPCPDGPYNPPGNTGPPASCKGPPLYNNFYGAGEIDALAVAK